MKVYFRAADLGSVGDINLPEDLVGSMVCSAGVVIRHAEEERVFSIL